MLLSRWWYYLSSIPTLLLGVRNWPRMLAAFLHLPVASPFVLDLRNGCRFWVRTPMDIWVIKEICLDHQYELASVEFEDGWTVLDIGAGLGDFSVTMARKNPHGSIYAYEPFAPSYALLQQNLRLNGVTHVATFPLAIAADSGSAQMHIASEAVAHSTISAGEGPALGMTPVQTVSLDQVLDSLQIARCDYLKMDCEGAEYPVFLNASAATLQRIRRLCLEYHDNLTEFSHHDLVRIFTQHGFSVRITPCPAYRHLGLLYAENRGMQHGDAALPQIRQDAANAALAQ
jgi:FkbM family methyltransferase